MTTHIVKFSDSTIKRFADNESISQLRDPRYSLRFRYKQNRRKGSWHLYKCVAGTEVWRKIGNWPNIKANDVIKHLSLYEAKLAAELDNTQLANEYESLATLLNWYRDRSQTDRNITASRKRVIKWAINKHLLPCLKNHSINQLSHDQLDSILFWPLQQDYENSTVSTVWRVLKQSLNKAHKLKLIDVNPLTNYQFTDFINAKIEAKATEVTASMLPNIIEQTNHVSIQAQLLVLMMLLHGTRIGETRTAKWEYIDFELMQWHIPAEHTKTRQAIDYPLTPLSKRVLIAYRNHQHGKGYSGVFLFPSGRKGKAINENRATKLIREVSQTKWRSHSLRKAARQIWINVLEIDYLIGEMLLNHALNKVDKAYIQSFANGQMRKALERYHAWIDEQTCFYLSAFSAETITRSRSKPITSQTNNDKG